MKTGMQVALEMGLEPGKESYSGADFDAIDCPMVVACTGCGMTMTAISPSVRVDAAGYVWCVGCSRED